MTNLLGPFWRPVMIVMALCTTQIAVGQSELPNPSSSVTYGGEAGGNVLVIGCVTNNPKYNYGLMQDIANYMLEHMRPLGIDSVEIFTVDSYKKMITLLNSGRVDWVGATPYSALLYEELAGGEFLATKRIRGNASYRSVFFARTDAKINSIDDLVGKVIAFEKPGSTTAHFLPATEILNAGYKLVELSSPIDVPPPGTIGFVYSGDEANSSIWVHKRIVAAAAFSDEDWESDWNMPAGFRDDIEIFHQTREVPRSIEVVRKDLDENLKQKIKATLFAANSDPDASDALHGYYRASEFTNLTAQQHEVLEEIRQAMHSFEKIGKKQIAPVKKAASKSVQQ